MSFLSLALLWQRRPSLGDRPRELVERDPGRRAQWIRRVSVLFKFQRRSHSCLFSSRIRGVTSGLVSALGVAKLGATTCSMKTLALK